MHRQRASEEMPCCRVNAIRREEGVGGEMPEQMKKEETDAIGADRPCVAGQQADRTNGISGRIKEGRSDERLSLAG